MAVFNKKNAVIGWAVLEAARLLTNKSDTKAASGQKPKKRRAGKALAAATGAVVAVGGVATLRRRYGGSGIEK